RGTRLALERSAPTLARSDGGWRGATTHGGPGPRRPGPTRARGARAKGCAGMLRFSLRGIASKPPAVRRSWRGGPRSARSVELVVVASLVLGSAQAHVEPEPNAPSRDEDARDEDARDEATRNDPALREAI